MRSAGTILCAIPGSCWSPGEQVRSKSNYLQTMQSHLRALATLERQLGKKSVLEETQSRYTRVCEEIEKVAVANSVFAPKARAFSQQIAAGKFSAVRISSEYVDLIRREHHESESTGLSHSCRLGTSVFSPQQAAQHISPFLKIANRFGASSDSAIRHRAWFLRKRIIPNNCGLIEFPDPIGSPMSYDGLIHPNAQDGRSVWQRFINHLFPSLSPDIAPEIRRQDVTSQQATVKPSTDWQKYEDKTDRGDFMASRLRNQIEMGLAHQEAVNIGLQRHNMATSILQEYIHLDSNNKPSSIPVIYDDGRTAPAFPLKCVARLPEGWKPTKEFHVGLVSMRHLPIDCYIDLNWYRNVEVPSFAGLAEADKECFQYSLSELAQLLDSNRGQRLRINIYHAGYLPAVMGFYRAVTTLLSSRNYDSGCLQVIPKLQPDKDGFVEGRPWPE